MQPHIVHITDLAHPALRPYAALTEAQLRHPQKGDGRPPLFIAESPKVIAVALDAGYEAESMLCEERHIEGDAAPLLARCPGLTVYTGARELLQRLTGYTLTRGVLCAMRRKDEPRLGDVVRDARRVVVIDGVTDTTNIGAIFRSAAALGIDAAVLTRQSCDPLNRRAVRVSMGSVFLLPWTWVDSADELKPLGFQTVAMALRHDSIALDDPQLKAQPRLAIIMGTEGDGLSAKAISEADHVVKIPMAHGVDSLNVAAASAVAFWELCK